MESMVDSLTYPHLQTHAAVRIRPSSVDWEVQHLTQKRRFRTSVVGCMLLVAFLKQRDQADAIAEVQRYIGASVNQLRNMIAEFVRYNVLVPPQHPDHLWASALIREWAAHNWREAADYHLASFDYPFYNYSDGGRDADASLMRRYVQQAPDCDRFKRYDETDLRLQAPTARESLETIDVSVRGLWAREVARAGLDSDRLLRLMSIGFGQLRLRHIDPSGQRSPLLRKTSPSGGARHPTEGYAIVLRVDGMAAGIYHFDVADNELVRIARQLDEEELTAWCRGVMRAPFAPAAIVIMTSVFERNMYRYREPRTFRTVFMDVGHVCGTLRLVASAMGLQSYAHHGLADQRLEEMLCVNGLEEGVLYGLAIS